MTVAADASLVISRKGEKSPSTNEAGDLSAQSLHREEYLSLMTAGSPAGDDEAAGSISLYESHKKEALKKYFTFLQSHFIL